MANSMQHQPFQTLGLDIGTNSLGWALVSNDSSGQATSLVDLGSRIFQEAVDAKSREPKNKARQRARAARRIIARRRQRKSKLRNLLIKHGLLPQELAGHTQPEVLLNQLDKLDGSANSNPYLLRKRGLDDPLTLHQFGRVLMHLCARRGFQSNRKSMFVGAIANEVSDLNEAHELIEDEVGSLGKKDQEELGIVKREIEGLRSEMSDSKSRSLGEFLATRWMEAPLERLRRRHTDRQMFKDEFELLWAAQALHHPKKLDDELKVSIERAIFFQRPLKSQKHSVGTCSLEPQRKRAMRGRLDVQEFLIRQDLVHLELLNIETRQFEKLRPDQQSKLFDVLQRQKTLTWSAAKKALGIKQTKTAKFNSEVDGGKSKLTGNRVLCDLRAALPDKWDNYSAEERTALIEDLLTMSSKSALYRRLCGHWALPRDQAYRLATLEMPSGYVNLSVKAINRLLPYLRKGLIYSQARIEAGYSIGVHSPKPLTQLPFPPEVRNPVVMKSLYELRKVVNAVIRTYGKPEVIRVEMARDIAMSPFKLEKANKRNKENQRLNAEAQDEYEKIYPGSTASRDDKIKYRLWKECGGVCPYTGRSISMTSLFTSGQWDIEHIHPESRTLDNSYMNKTLCEAEFNRLRKKGQTPWEVFQQGPDSDEWKDVLQRIKKLPLPKQRRFTQKELGPIEDFISRQLNDTRHIAVAVANYLATIGVDVQFTKGAMTSDLRHWWGLNSCLNETNNKDRTDHRHHAIDAVAIALTTRRIYQRLHQNAVQNERRRKKPISKPLPEPWPTLRSDVATALHSMVVSHAPNRKIAGALHQDTAYGTIRMNGEEIFVGRKMIDSNFTRKQAEKIIDSRVRERVLARLDACGNDPKKAFSDLDSHPIRLSNAGENATVIRRVRIKAEASAKSTVCIPKADNQGRFFLLGSYHHAAIFRNLETTRFRADYVSMMEAARRARRIGANPTSRTPPANWGTSESWEFVMTLTINDLLFDERNERYYRVQNLEATNDRITLRDHRSATVARDSTGITKTLNSLLSNMLLRKVNIDPIGRVFATNE